MSKTPRNPPLSVIATRYLEGKTSAESFRLQAIAAVVGLPDDILKSLARALVIGVHFSKKEFEEVIQEVLQTFVRRLDLSKEDFEALAQILGGDGHE